MPVAENVLTSGARAAQPLAGSGLLSSAAGGGGGDDRPHRPERVVQIETQDERSDHPPILAQSGR